MGKTVAKLHIASQAAARARGAYRPAVASPGASEVGWLSLGLGNQVAGQNPALGVNFKSVLQAAPTSITLTATAQNNVGSTSVSNLSVYGFNFNWTVPANGATVWLGTYKTNGN